MKKTILFIGLFIGLMSCNQPTGNHPDFEANLEIAKKFIQLHEVEDYKTQESLLHDDLLWQPPVYGAPQYGKAEHVEAMKMYQTMFDNITYEAQNWLPGVNAETGMLDGSVRTYGTWKGTHTESGKSFSLTSYHTMDFKEGKIVAGGDYFDFGGFMVSFIPEEEGTASE